MRSELTRDHFPRLLALLTYLAETGGAHVDELAFHFGVSPDRIRKDLSTLWVAGLPGESPEDLIDFTFDETDTFVALRQGLGLDRPLRLTPRETVSLLLALRAIQPEVTGGVLQDELAALIGQLEALLPAASADVVADDRFATLRAAVRERRTLAFDYVSATDETSRRTVDPLRIEERPAGWYLLAFCHDAQAVRTFAIERIGGIEDAPEPWQAPKNALAGHADIPETTTVSLLTDPALNWLAERFAAPKPRLTKDGTLTFEIEFYSKERLVRTLLSVADRITRVHPPEAAQVVADRARYALGRMADVHAAAQTR
ncbi:hypothetical protein BSZ39_04790 [Bowdeniella nasicola]|uniref:Proteasome accessory factor C n=1 Tax=Bowdeniella nasicola TaxID=208480 RepID=A0A1Q5Q397_9ACTO|nr:WYL domain-containing protein [Bowdeniella nasicola]OKL54286.1 hypothetical protein BSZ39_04790 [Bowdeniella nasicola]